MEHGYEKWYNFDEFNRIKAYILNEEETWLKLYKSGFSMKYYEEYFAFQEEGTRLSFAIFQKKC